MKRLRVSVWLAIAAIALEVIVCLSVPLFGRDPYHPDLTGSVEIDGQVREVVSRDGLPVGPSSVFPLGADMMGRDVLSRLLHGARVSLGVGLASSILGLLIGTMLGLVAGFFGGVIDTLLSRSMDLVLAFPVLLFAVALATTVEGSSAGTAVVIIALATWPYLGRLVRAEVLRLKALPFIEAARALGSSHGRVIVRHVLPNLVGPLAAFGTLSLASNILFEAALAFLGLGVPPPTPSWGGMIRDGVPLYNVAWWITVFPGAAIVLTAVAWNVLGEELERRFVRAGRLR